MKKILFILSLICISIYATAQEGCMQFFPNTPGTQLISKTYDAGNNLLHAITYHINSNYNFSSQTNMNIDVKITDNQGKALSRGTINAMCQNGVFNLNMNTQGYAPEFMDLMSTSTELIGNFLDYPNTFVNDFLSQNTFQMQEVSFSVNPKESDDYMSVRVYYRNYEINEKVKTPAGEFDASRVSFMFDVNRNGTNTTYRGIEWYALNAGIVRSETYDSNNNLISYSELTEIRNNDN